MKRTVFKWFNIEIEKGANIEANDNRERTPLHVACENNETGVVKYLISKGVNKNCKDKWGNTPYG